jgi:NADH-quinone oxidoreductase subunit C
MPDETKPDETVEQRRARRIAEAREKLRGPGTVSANAEGLIPPGARPASETVEEIKAAPEGPGGAVDSTVDPATAKPETLEERRARRIADARAKLQGGGQTPSRESAGAGVAGETPGGPTAKPASPGAAKTPAPKKTRAGLEITDLSEDPLVKQLRKRFGDAVASAVAMLGQPIVTVTRAVQPRVLEFLRSDPEARFDLLLDVTAVHRPDEEPAFEVVYQLVAPSTGRRLRVKVGIADGESIPSATPIWATANWLERECFDMFGIVFDGHPDLRRILLPEGWEGHPLRKEYPVEFRENQWVRDNLNIIEIPAGGDFTGKFEA